MRQVTEEQGNTYQSIASVVTGRINNSTIAFATDNSAYLFHLGSYIHFAYSRSGIFLTVLTCYVTQRTGRTQVGNRIARSVLQHIVGHGNQRIFFTVHLTVLTNHGQTVYIRVYHKSNVCLTAFHKVHDVAQILFQRFRIVLEITGRLAVEFLHMLHSELFQQLRKNDAAYGVYTINGYTEIGFPDSFHIHQVKRQHTVDMLLVISKVFAIRAELVHFGKVELFSFGNTKHFIALLLVQELSFLIQKFQGIPLLGIVRSSQDDTSAGTFHGNSQFGSRSRSQIDVHYIPAHTHERAYHHILYHLARDACITAYYNFVAFYCTRFADKRSVCRSKLHNVERVQPLACTTAYCSADSRDRFD